MNQTGIDDKSPGLPVQDSQAIGMLWQVHPDMLCTLNPSGYIETYNAAWHSTLGWSGEDLSSRSIWEMIYPEDIERTRVEAMACCRFRGHRVKVFPMKLERMNATKEVQPRVQA